MKVAPPTLTSIIGDLLLELSSPLAQIACLPYSVKSFGTRLVQAIAFPASSTTSSIYPAGGEPVTPSTKFRNVWDTEVVHVQAFAARYSYHVGCDEGSLFMKGSQTLWLAADICPYTEAIFRGRTLPRAVTAGWKRAWVGGPAACRGTWVECWRASG